MTDTIDTILTEREKEIAIQIIDSAGEIGMTGDGLGIIANRFGFQLKAVADWYYNQKAIAHKS